jgi:hypothetical protein
MPFARSVTSLGVDERLQLHAIAHWSPGAMPFDQLDVGKGVVRHAVGAIHRERLACDAWCGDAAAAVGGIADSANDRIDAVAIAQRIRETLEDYHAAALARQKTARPLIVDANVAVTERADLGEADELERIKAHVDAAGEHELAQALLETDGSFLNREQ